MNKRLVELNEQREIIDAQMCTQLDNIIETLGVSQNNLVNDLVSLTNLTVYQVSLLELHLDKIRSMAENVTRTIFYVGDYSDLYEELCIFRSIESSLIFAIEKNRR